MHSRSRRLSVAALICGMSDGIWIQNASAADLPKFYVTEIRLE